MRLLEQLVSALDDLGLARHLDVPGLPRLLARRWLGQLWWPLYLRWLQLIDVPLRLVRVDEAVLGAEPQVANQRGTLTRLSSRGALTLGMSALQLTLTT